MVEGSGIEDIKNAQLKGEMWENIAKDYQKITGKVTTGHAIRMRWKNFKYNRNEQFKNWKCKICNEVFESFSDLKDHTKIHRHENHKCEICSKLFSKKSNLQHHIRSVHEGVKNHLCGFCDKAFSQASDLKKHMRNKHSDATIHEGFAEPECLLEEQLDEPFQEPLEEPLEEPFQEPECLVEEPLG